MPAPAAWRLAWRRAAGREAGRAAGRCRLWERRRRRWRRWRRAWRERRARRWRRRRQSLRRRRGAGALHGRFLGAVLQVALVVEEESEAAVLQELLLRSLLFAGSLVVLRSARRQLRDPLPPRCNTPATRLCYVAGAAAAARLPCRRPAPRAAHAPPAAAAGRPLRAAPPPRAQPGVRPFLDLSWTLPVGAAPPPRARPGVRGAVACRRRRPLRSALPRLGTPPPTSPSPPTPPAVIGQSQ